MKNDIINMQKTEDVFFNCYSKEPTNQMFQTLQKANVYLWINKDGDFRYRIGKHGDITTVTNSKIKTILHNILKHRVTINEPDATAKDWNIDTSLLHLSAGDIFNPFKNKEFYRAEYETFRNTFRTTKYLKIRDKYKQTPFSKPIDISAIDALILHLVNYREDRREWVHNWLAYFFQTLKKSPVALVLLGKQGAGKGIFFNKVIKPLFGDNQTIQVNDKTIKGNFLGGIIDGKLFINLDEISTSARNNQELKNQLKMLVSNTSGTFEKKFETTEKETQIYAQILITSNEPKALDIEKLDRRFCVYKTGDNIANCDYLNYDTYEILIRKIEEELDDYAYYLASYPVDIKKATTAPNTPEKEALVQVSNTKFQSFAQAIQNKDLSFFDDTMYVEEVKQAFEQNRINKSMLRTYFYSVFGEAISAAKLNQQLQAISPEFFSMENLVGRKDGTKLYKLDPTIPIIDTNVKLEEDTGNVKLQKASEPMRHGITTSY